MKTFKKLCAAFCAVLLVMSMSIPAFAADVNYTITISNSKANQTYTAYKLFDVESYSGNDKAVYTIKVDDDFYEFVSTGDGASYVTLTKSETATDTYYVTWKDNVDETTASEFAKLAVAYAEDKGITAAGTVNSTSDDQEDLTISVDNPGYYVVDTTLGSLASLDTTNPTAEIQEKNGVPNVTKTVLEDSSNAYGSANTASIGDTVTFITKIEVAETATDYVLYDSLGEGFTLNADSIKVYTDEDCTTELKDESGSAIYTVTTENAGTYKPTSTSADDVTASFKIAFIDGPWDGVTYDAYNEGAVYVKYTATLNSSAALTYDTVSANYNKTYLTYGENDTATAEANTKTYTYAFDLVKTDEYSTLLDGASFQLKDADGNAITFTLTNGNYVVDPDGKVDKIEVTDGQAKIIGLDAGKYTLAETVTPDGYNRASDTTITVTGDATTATVNGNVLNATINGTAYTKGGVCIVNKSGSLLPSTGGIGTTIFYIVGGCLVIGAIVFLVTRRRMSAEGSAE